jgi:hypothetical protein
LARNFISGAEPPPLLLLPPAAELALELELEAEVEPEPPVLTPPVVLWAPHPRSEAPSPSAVKKIERESSVVAFMKVPEVSVVVRRNPCSASLAGRARRSLNIDDEGANRPDRWAVSIQRIRVDVGASSP